MSWGSPGALALCPRGLGWHSQPPTVAYRQTSVSKLTPTMVNKPLHHHLFHALAEDGGECHRSKVIHSFCTFLRIGIIVVSFHALRTKLMSKSAERAVLPHDPTRLHTPSALVPWAHRDFIWMYPRQDWNNPTLPYHDWSRVRAGRGLVHCSCSLVEPSIKVCS